VRRFEGLIKENGSKGCWVSKEDKERWEHARQCEMSVFVPGDPDIMISGRFFRAPGYETAHHSAFPHERFRPHQLDVSPVADGRTLLTDVESAYVVIDICLRPILIFLGGYAHAQPEPQVGRLLAVCQPDFERCCQLFKR
jgi:hypothetical protein